MLGFFLMLKHAIFAACLAAASSFAAAQDPTVQSDDRLPSFVDIWQDIFLGRPTMQNRADFNDNAARQRPRLPLRILLGSIGNDLHQQVFRRFSTR
jgi:hypothetical protein